jgi:hypothetical protein
MLRTAVLSNHKPHKWLSVTSGGFVEDQTGARSSDAERALTVTLGWEPKLSRVLHRTR